MLTTLICMAIGAFSVFTLFGRVLTTYEANDEARIKAILRDVYLDIVIAMVMVTLFANTSASSLILHYLTVKFVIMHMANYDTLLATEVN